MKRTHRKTTCGRCPKYQTTVCVVLAKYMVPQHPACELGRRLINSRDTCARAKAKRV